MKNITNKKAFRKQAIAKLHANSYYRYQASKKIEQKLERLIQHKNPKSILFYIPMEHEANITTLLKKQRKKRKVYLPFMVDDSFKMVGYSLPLKRAKFGIWEAKNSIKTIKHVDMIIVPMLGVDRNYKRIGFGKGMYDRFVERLQQKTLLVFVAQTLLQTHHTITNSYDIKANYIITSKKYLTIKR